MKKYRIMLLDNRVIGPFSTIELMQLASQKRITGDEKFQLFPTGDWLNAKSIPEVSACFSNDLDGVDEATFVRKLSDLGLESETSEENFPKEFKFESELTSMTPLKASDHVEPKRDDPPEIDLESTESDSEKTELATKAVIRQSASQDKTVINPDTLKYLEQEKIKKEAQLEKEAFEKKIEEDNKEPDLNEDSTQFISLDELDTAVSEEVDAAEAALEIEAKKQIEKLKKAKKKTTKNNKKNDVSKDDSSLKNKSRRKPIIIFAAIALMAVVLLPDEPEKKTAKKITVTYPQIIFPQQYDTPDSTKAGQLYNEAMAEYRKGSYSAKVKAASLFKASVENKFKDNPAAAWLILTYSELLPHSDDKLADANRIFKLVQIFNSKALRDPTLVAGMALFYLNVDKAQAAVKVIEKFNTIESNKPTLELFSVYLQALIKSGELVKAKAVEQKLAAVSQKSLLVYLNLYDYYILKGEYANAAKIIVEAEDRKLNQVSLLLRKADLFLYKDDFQSLEKLLIKIKSKQAGSSKVLYSRYLELKALVEAQKNMPEKAIASFKKALEMNESIELRSRLASLKANSTDEANGLINESKSIKLISDSKSHLAKGNHKFAFKDALEAARVAPNYLPAKLHLAKLQVEQSFFKEAIKSLEELYEKFPHDPSVVFSLIDAYIEAYKFEKVTKLLNILSVSDMRAHPSYFSKTAKYYVYKDEFPAAVAWLQKAINVNPLDDYNTFELAKLFIKYGKFNQAKVLLGKAMDLDPANVEYRVAYAEILYETENANAAIGYLYDVLNDFPDNSKLLGAIGIYYYRSGQIKLFQNTKDKLLKLPQKDGALFEFLIKAAKMDQKFDDVVKYSKELIDINPGDLRTRLFLGQIYMEMSKYKEALVQFNVIKERLDTYPKLQFFMSKLYLLTDNIAKAKELAKREIAGNPGTIHGYVILGDILKKEQKYNEAEKEYKKAQKINPKNVDVLIGLAYINFMKSQYEIALDLFKKAKRFDPGREETYKLLGDVYRKIGQSSLAVESYKMFLELSPNTRYKQNLQNYINMMQ